MTTWTKVPAVQDVWEVGSYVEESYVADGYLTGVKQGSTSWASGESASTEWTVQQ